MLVGAGLGAYNIYTDLVGSAGGGGGHTETVATPVGAGGTGGVGGSDHTTGSGDDTAPLNAKDVRNTAADFLGAWSRGDLASAAGLTDAEQAAVTALTDYRDSGHVTSLDAVPGKASAGQVVPFTVTARVGFQGARYRWTYASSLTVARNASGTPAVEWAPSVLHPDLAVGDTLVTGSPRALEAEITDRDGTPMDAADYPSLARIFADFRARYADRFEGGSPGVETYVQKADGSIGELLHVWRKGRPARLATTLDARLQAAAEKAVAGEDQSGVTALDTRTGGILAVAYNPVGGPDIALQDNSAPGSTFKIVTAAALLESGLTPSSSAPCLDGYTPPMGRAYHNDGNVSRQDATLDWDFAESCNTGFIAQADRLGPTGLVDTAAEFGLTHEWNVGTPTLDDQPKVPGGTGDELTSEMIGQGQLEMNPLIMASVAATASTGHFHQPRIVAKHLIDPPVITAPGLSPRTTSQLRSMMHSAITYGTASTAMRGFGSDAGAKTGSAEIDGAPTTNGWFTAYTGHVAAAAVVHGGGHGNTSAGPIVALVLGAG